MPTRPRVLYITHRVPHPPDKGDRIRNYHVLRELAKDARVTLVSLADEPVTEATTAELHRLCETVEIIPALGKRRWLRAGRSLLTGGSLSEGLFAEPKLDAALRRLAEAQSWDASLVSASSLAPYLERHGLPAKPRFVDLVDVDSQKWFDYADAASGPKNMLYTLEGHRVRRLEQWIAEWAAGVFIVSPAECAVFDGFTRSQLAPSPGSAGEGWGEGLVSKNPSPPAPLPQSRERGEVVVAHAGAGTVATNGVDLDYFQPRPDVESVRACAFVGALDYLPNIDGAVWFANDIWPAIRTRHPDAEFWIVGRNPTPAVRRLATIDGVKVVGAVPDVRPHVAKAALAVCPIRIARGLQNKVLEAMAMAKPTLAAPAAIRALKAVPGEHLLSPTTEEEWIAAIGDLLDDPVRQRELGAAARAFVEVHHHWDRCLQPLVRAILDSAVQPVPS